MITVEEIGSLQVLDSYKESWNALLQNSDTNVVFLTYEYCRSFWEVYGDEQELFVLIAKKDSEVIGIAPLTIRTVRWFGRSKRRVEFIGSQQSDYIDFIIPLGNEDVLRCFYQYLWSVRSRWDVISLEQIPESSSTIFIQKHLHELNASFSVWLGSSCPIVQVEGCREEVQKKINKQKTLRNCINRLKRIGDLEYGCAKDVEEGLCYVDSFFQLHINRWKDTITPSKFYKEHQRQFYRQLVRTLGDKGWLHLAYLNLNDVPIALIFGFEYNGSLSVHRTVYDSFYFKYSVGRMIVRYAVQYCLDNGLKNLDLLAGAEEYKGYITNDVLRTQQIHIYKSLMSKLLGQFNYIVRKYPPFSCVFSDGKIWRFRMNLRKYRMRYGTIELIKKIIHRATSHIIDFSSNQIFQCSQEPTEESTPKYPLEIRVGNNADLNLIASFYGHYEKSPQVAELKKRLEQGDKPYLAYCGKALAHIAWVCQRRKVEMGEIWGSVALGEDEAYIMDCHTSFIFRGKGIYPAVLQRIWKDLAAEKIIKVYIGSKASNKASLDGIQKAGFLLSKKIFAVKLFGKKLGAKTVPLGSG